MKTSTDRCQVQLLLKAKADPDLEGADEQTPLLQAADGGSGAPRSSGWDGMMRPLEILEMIFWYYHVVMTNSLSWKIHPFYS